MDEIQADLEQWSRGDRRAGLRVVRALVKEWTPRVRAMLRSDEGRVEDAVQDMLVRLALPRGDRPPRALAPTDAHNAKGWRLKVLKNELVSWLRHEAVRERAEEASRQDLGRAGARELRERRQTDGPEAPPLMGSTDGGMAAFEDQDELAARREAVWRALPRLVLRRRVAVALELGMDPTPWAEELAAELGEDAGEIAARMASALAGGERHLVFRPDGNGAEAYRKAHERGVEDLRALLAKEKP